MAEMSSSYRERLARMAGGGGRGGAGAKASSAVVTTGPTRRTRGPRSEPSSRVNSSINNQSKESRHLPPEYKQMRSDMLGSTTTATAVSTRSDAAALQNDLAQRYNLQNAVRPTQKKQRAPRDSSLNHQAGVRRSPPPRLCNSCQASNPHNSSVCESCGYFLAGSQQIPLTMAQSRGLVVAPRPPDVEPLQPFEWECIEKGVASRHDAYCPICMDGFNRGYEVLLSCSHMYHRSCLQSFEKFMKTAERSCPICRTTNYQKKITHAGTKAFELVCAVVIQRNWRGYWCRSLYYDELKKFYKNGGASTSSCRKKFYEKELCSYTNKLAKEGDSMESEVNSLFHASDKVMQENRDLDLAFELMMMERHNFGGMTEFSTRVEGVWAGDGQAQPKGSTYTDTDTDIECGEVSRAQWNDILQGCLKRGGNEECAICMSDIEKNRNRRVVLLSCSHMFHQQCIMMLEDFVKNAEDCPLCPMCRCPFERKLLARDCNAFDDAPPAASALLQR